VDEPEDREMFRQRPRPGEQRFEDNVRDRRGHCLGYEAVQRRTAGPSRKGSHRCSSGDPKLAVIGRGGESAEEGIMVPSREIRNMPHQVSVQAADPSMAPAPFALHSFTLPRTESVFSGGAEQNVRAVTRL
jgi:hypothetical protein